MIINRWNGFNRPLFGFLVFWFRCLVRHLKSLLKIKTDQNKVDQLRRAPYTWVHDEVIWFNIQQAGASSINTTTINYTLMSCWIKKSPYCWLDVDSTLKTLWNVAICKQTFHATLHDFCGVCFSVEMSGERVAVHHMSANVWYWKPQKGT